MEGMGGTDSRAQTLAHLLQHRAEIYPDKVAVITFDQKVTYGDLWSKACNVAEYLQRTGIAHGSRVALLMENCVEWVEIAAGVSCAGAQLIALSTWVEEWDLQRLLSSSCPELLFVSSRARGGAVAGVLAELLPELTSQVQAFSFTGRDSLKGVVEVGSKALPGAAPYEGIRGGVGADMRPLGVGREVGLVLFSSGSTSMPKGVGLVNEDIAVNAAAIGDRIGLSADDRLFVPMPMFWAFGGPNGMMACLTRGAALVTLDRFEAGRALDLIERERCTALYTMPNMTSAMLNHPRFSRVRVASLDKGITVGSSAEIGVVIENLGVTEICNVYGCSELYANATVTPFTAPKEERMVSHGPPLPGVTVKIVDRESGREMEAGSVGEIRVAGRVAAGYLQPDGSVKGIVDGDGYFATGDLGYLDQRGWLTYVGRATDMVKIRGVNVSPAEVEDFLCSHVHVESALVFGVEEPGSGELLVAMVVVKAGAQTTVGSIRDWCNGKIASYKMPWRLLVVDALPTTQTGKISRASAKKAFMQVAGRVSVVPD